MRESWAAARSPTVFDASPGDGPRRYGTCNGGRHLQLVREILSPVDYRVSEGASVMSGIGQAEKENIPVAVDNVLRTVRSDWPPFSDDNQQ